MNISPLPRESLRNDSERSMIVLEVIQGVRVDRVYECIDQVPATGLSSMVVMVRIRLAEGVVVGSF